MSALRDPSKVWVVTERQVGNPAASRVVLRQSTAWWSADLALPPATTRALIGELEAALDMLGGAS